MSFNSGLLQMSKRGSSNEKWDEAVMKSKDSLLRTPSDL